VISPRRGPPANAPRLCHHVPDTPLPVRRRRFIDRRIRLPLPMRDAPRSVGVWRHAMSRRPVRPSRAMPNVAACASSATNRREPRERCPSEDIAYAAAARRAVSARRCALLALMRRRAAPKTAAGVAGASTGSC